MKINTQLLTKAPYGYQIKDGKLVPNPAEVAVIRRIFSLLKVGGSRWACTVLKKEGVVNRLNKPFASRSISRIGKRDYREFVEDYDEVREVIRERMAKKFPKCFVNDQEPEQDKDRYEKKLKELRLTIIRLVSENRRLKRELREHYSRPDPNVVAPPFETLPEG